TIQNPTATPGVTTTYVLTTSYAGYCNSTDEVTVFIQDPLSATLLTDGSWCERLFDVYITSAGGDGPATFTWYLDDVPVGTTKSITVNNSSAAHLKVEITNMCGTIILEEDLPPIAYSGSPAPNGL